MALQAAAAASVGECPLICSIARPARERGGGVGALRPLLRFRPAQRPFESLQLIRVLSDSSRNLA